MKKIIALLFVCVSFAFTGCGAKEQVEVVAPTFEGEYMVSPEYVKENLEDIILIDARGDEAASKGTIKGAIPLMWQYIASCDTGKSGDEMWGCILDPETLSQRLGEKGIDPEKEIVLFASAQQGWGDDGRIAWELMAAGYENVKLVDGTYDMLVAAGLETEKGGATPETIEVNVESIDETHVINTEELKSVYNDVKIIDVRADEEYAGEVLYGEANGGHLPGAIHVRFTDLFEENGNLKSNDDIQAIFDEVGLEKDDAIVTYCTAGIRSAYMQLILEQMGYENSKNYDESFYRWSAVEELEK